MRLSVKAFQELFGSKPPRGARRQRPVYREDAEARALMEWVAVAPYPELECLYHIPNERADRVQRMRLGLQGVRSGVPDYHLPLCKKNFCGLWFELKAAEKAANLTDNQKRWIIFLRNNGHCVDVCHGWTEAKDFLVEYLRDGPAFQWDYRWKTTRTLGDF